MLYIIILIRSSYSVSGWCKVLFIIRSVIFWKPYQFFTSLIRIRFMNFFLINLFSLHLIIRYLGFLNGLRIFRCSITILSHFSIIGSKISNKIFSEFFSYCLSERYDWCHSSFLMHEFLEWLNCMMLQICHPKSIQRYNDYSYRYY